MFNIYPLHFELRTRMPHLVEALNTLRCRSSPHTTLSPVHLIYPTKHVGCVALGEV